MKTNDNNINILQQEILALRKELQHQRDMTQTTHQQFSQIKKDLAYMRNKNTELKGTIQILKKRIKS